MDPADPKKVRQKESLGCFNSHLWGRVPTSHAFFLQVIVMCSDSYIISISLLWRSTYDSKANKALSGFYYIESDGVIYQTRCARSFPQTRPIALVGDVVEFTVVTCRKGHGTKILPRKMPSWTPHCRQCGYQLISAHRDQNFDAASCVSLSTWKGLDVHPVIMITKTDLLVKWHVSWDIKSAL